jgi:TIR domain
MNHIFISHSHEDNDFAENLQNRLREADLTAWRDTDIAGGEDWREEIDRAIKEAFTLLVVMTDEAKRSEYVAYEWAFALGNRVKVVPILLQQTTLHPRLESLQYLDFTNRRARPWETLITLLRELEHSAPFRRQADSNHPEVPAELELGYDERKSRLPDSQKAILQYLEEESLRRASVPQDDFESKFGSQVKSIYWRLECLYLLGFVEKEVTNFRQTTPIYNYRLSSRYREWLSKFPVIDKPNKQS